MHSCTHLHFATYCIVLSFFRMNGWLLYHMHIVKIIDNKFIKLHLNLLHLDKE